MFLLFLATNYPNKIAPARTKKQTREHIHMLAQMLKSVPDCDIRSTHHFVQATHQAILDHSFDSCSCVSILTNGNSSSKTAIAHAMVMQQITDGKMKDSLNLEKLFNEFQHTLLAENLDEFHGYRANITSLHDQIAKEDEVTL